MQRYGIVAILWQDSGGLPSANYKVQVSFLVMVGAQDYGFLSGGPRAASWLVPTPCSVRCMAVLGGVAPQCPLTMALWSR
eukprot:5212321-Amphidinium_carterae.1